MGFKVKHEKGSGWIVLSNLIKDTQQNKTLKVGFLGNKKYPNKGVTTAQTAYAAEFGNAKKNVPPRPFMRPAINKNKEKWSAIATGLYQQVLAGKLRFWTVFDRLGFLVRGDFQKEIKAVNSPPLSEKTVKTRIAKRKRGVDTKSIRKPLVDSGLLFNSVTHSLDSDK